MKKTFVAHTIVAFALTFLSAPAHAAFQSEPDLSYWCECDNARVGCYKIHGQNDASKTAIASETARHLSVEKCRAKAQLLTGRIASLLADNKAFDFHSDEDGWLDIVQAGPAKSKMSVEQIAQLIKAQPTEVTLALVKNKAFLDATCSEYSAGRAPASSKK